MNIVNNTIAFILVGGVLVASLIGCIITIIRYRYPKPNPYSTNLVSTEVSLKKMHSLRIDWISWLQLSLFFLLFAVSLIVLCYLCFIKADKPASPPVENTPIVTPSAPVSTPTNTPNQYSEEPLVQFHRLDEIAPIEERDGNVSIKGWGDGTDLSIDGRSYSFGIGLQFTGTPFETVVSAENSPGKIYRNDCKEVSVEYALRCNYKTLVFSMGADNGDVTSFGNEENNGVAQVILIDKATSKILFDTGWVNYLYAVYDCSIDFSDVDVLKIIYRTCGVSNKYKLKYPLRFVIVDPILTLKDDSE